MNIRDIERVHMIGIGGIGMSALARLFLHEGKNVSGSDREASDIIRALEKEGVHFFDTQMASNITSKKLNPLPNLVVYTEAMPKDHEEMEAARALDIPMMSYFEALGMVANEYYLIAVSGAHGKTTTTAMITDVLEDAGLDPTAIIGSLRSKTGSNYRAGKSKYAVVEACEYHRDFLSLTPDVLVITNIEAEHLDYYTDLADIQHAFKTLVSQVREGGVVVAPASDLALQPVLEGVTTKVIDYAKYFDPLLSLKQPGLHNKLNAAAATAVAAHLGIDSAVTKTTLEKFAGTWRRFEYKGLLHGAPVYDDYGHHPTEIKATIKGARELYPDKKIVLVFQPHLASRTELLFDDFVDALAAADRVVLAPIYKARKEEESRTSSKLLAEVLTRINPYVTYIESSDAIVNEITHTVTEENVVLIMGAGDVTNIATRLTA